MPTAEKTAARIDADRRREEREILLLLLLLFGESYTHVRSAVRVGADPFAAATGVILGEPSRGLPGLPLYLAPALLRASYAGWRRTVLMVPRGPRDLVDENAGQPDFQHDIGGDHGRVVPTRSTIRREDDYATLARMLADAGYVPTIDYRERARQAAGQMLATLLGRIRDGAEAGLAGVRDSFTTWGYRRNGEHGAWALDTAATTLGIGSYEDGYAAGLARDEVQERLYGLRHVSVMDSRTSDICRARDAVRLPPSDPWWLSNWVQLHWHCRSSIIPIFHPFTATPQDDLPYGIPPQPGFGRAPDSAFGFAFRRAVGQVA